MRTGHFFAGIGGGMLASEILGHENKFAHEINEYRCAVLRRQFPQTHVECGDIREFDPSPWAGKLDCISAGFPCQDISCAGKGAGIRGSRSGLFFELVRCIDVIRPPFVFLENSPIIRTRGREVVIGELVALGYSWRDGTLAASHVGAGHKRNRWWCLAANTDEEHGNLGGFRPSVIFLQSPLISGSKDASDSFRDRLQIAIQRGWLSETDAEAIQAVAGYTGSWSWLPSDRGVCGMVDGVSNRTQSIAALGDTQVPLQAAVAWILLLGERERP